MSNPGGYYFPDLLPALAAMWQSDQAQALQVIDTCIEDATKRGLYISAAVLEQAKKQLQNGESLDHIGSPTKG